MTLFLQGLVLILAAIPRAIELLSHNYLFQSISFPTIYTKDVLSIPMENLVGETVPDIRFSDIYTEFILTYFFPPPCAETED
jgi:hypothetical protein